MRRADLFRGALEVDFDGADELYERERPEYPCRDCGDACCSGTCPESDVAAQLAREAELAATRELDAAELADATADGPMADVLARADAAAERFDKYLAGAGHAGDTDACLGNER